MSPILVSVLFSVYANADVYMSRLDMDLPILDILESVVGLNAPDLDYRKQWEEDVELYAPGYLALEAAGKGGEYDLNCLTAPIEIPDGLKAVYQKFLEAKSH